MKTLATKSYILFLAAFCFWLGSAEVANGQILDRTEDRAKRKTNQRIDRKIDRGIDSGLDAIEGVFKKKNKDKKADSDDESTASEPGRNPFGMGAMMGGNVEVEDAYNFDHTIDLKMEMYDKRNKKTTDMDMSILLSESSPHTAMTTRAEGMDGLVVFDMKNHQMLTLIDTEGAEKMGMAMSIDPADLEDEDEDIPQPKFTKTGRSESISGYKCQEYKVEEMVGDENNDTYVWMSTEAKINWMEAFSDMSQKNAQAGMQSSMLSTYPDGAMIKMVSTDSKGERMEMTVQNIHMNKPQSVSTKGYTFMSMNMKNKR